MVTVRLRLTLLAGLAALALGLLGVPAANASESGGAVAPSANSIAAPSGGAAVGSLPAVKRKAARRKAAAKRKAKARRKRVPAPPAAGAPAPVGESAHHFPVSGSYSLGGPDARFGAGREGHRHQGQDVIAAEGTPVVAPWAGLVEFVRFQKSGAGWYVVLDGDDEDRDYVFMHLRKDSMLIAPGQHVSAGQPLAQVGNTGSSSGPHLHFEIWVGGWFDGGKPIDPLPLLKQWGAVTP
jgi:murein DD-endopeptidase MepM/ murein hydrolase activator NlpD